jgi:hypothetical protein
MPSGDLSGVTLGSGLQCTLDVRIKEHVAIELTHRAGSGSSICLSKWCAERMGTILSVSATPTI